MRPFAPALFSLFALASAAHAAGFETPAREAILYDLTTDTVLFEKSADAPMPPSSMSKLMTTFMVLEKLKEGSLKMEDTFTVSEKAWRTGGSKMFVRVGDAVTVKDLLNGVSIQSGNDACVVLAEGLAGSEEAFAEMMNRKAKEIGLKGSHFTNATGLPDPNHIMTARDLMVLTRELLNRFPDYQWLFGQKEFTYNNIRQQNRNPLLDKNIGVDGMKTGHTEAAGYGVTITGEQQGRRVIFVINGLESWDARVAEAERIYNHAFRAYDIKTPFTKGATVTEIPIWMGTVDRLAAVASEDIRITLPKGAEQEVTMKVTAKGPIPAPIAAGDQLGTLTIAVPATGLHKEIPLVAAADAPALTGIKRWQKIALDRIFGKNTAVAADATANTDVAPAAGQ